MSVPESYLAKLDAHFESRQTTIARDLKLNFKKLVGEASLPADEALFTALAVASSVGEEKLITFTREALTELGVAEEMIQEAADSAGIMGMNNIYYRFRHMIHNDVDYKTAGLRMTGLARPAMGKEKFEMLAFAVSAINGCEMCITSHEKALRASGVSVDKVHDLVRLAAVIKGIQGLRL